jgi:ATP-binding cassette, subfamily B, bacterial MsbA
MTPARRLLPWLRPYRGRFAAALALGLLAAVAEGFTYSLLMPFLRLLFGADGAFPSAGTPVEGVLRGVVGSLVGAADGRTALALVLGCIAAALLVKNAALYAASYLGLVVQEGVARDLRIALYAHLQRLGLPFFTRTRTGELAARVLSDTDQTRGAVRDVGGVLRSAVAVAVYAAILAALSWRLALAALAGVLLVTAALRPLVRAVRARWVDVTAHRGALGAVTVETALAARAVKAAAAEPQEAARFAAAADAVRRGVLRAERAALLASPLTEAVAGGAILLLLAAASGAGGMRPEVFVTFVAVALRMLSPMKAVAQFPALLAEAGAAADRLYAVLDRPAEEDDPPDALPFPGLRSAVEFRDVWVAYEPDAWVLRGVSLRLGRGEVVAVVGPSGAGKSTLADLLPRFVEPARGAVFVDDVPLARIGRRAIRRALGIVSQDTVLLHETVRANIAYGDRADASLPEIEAAARAANAAGFIARLPDGYDTVIGERGVRLSGGERQRLAIARALLRDPPLLILDEATAHLDAEAEREVQEAIARLMAGRTVLVIAHRLATVAHADRVVVLDGGRIVEDGPPAALLVAGGRYQRMVGLQARVGALPDSPPLSGPAGRPAEPVEWRLEVEDRDR